ILEYGGAREQPDDARNERDQPEGTGPCREPLVPALRRQGARRAREQRHGRRADEQYARGEVAPQRAEQQRVHSTRNVKPPSVTSASIDSTRQRTWYVPGGSIGSVARSRAGFARSTWPSRRSTCSPLSLSTRTALYAGSSRSVKYSLTSSGERLSRLSAGGSARWSTACAAAVLAISAQSASVSARRSLAESRFRLVVGDDVARLEPEQIVGRAGAAGRRHGTRSAIVPGRPDHLVAGLREHRARAVDARLIERRVHDGPLPFLAGRIVVDERHPVELAEVVHGHDAQHEAVARDGVEPALVTDRVEELALIALGRLPCAVHHLAGIEVPVGRRAICTRSEREEYRGVVRAWEPERHEAVVGVLGIDAGTDVLCLA